MAAHSPCQNGKGSGPVDPRPSKLFRISMGARGLQSSNLLEGFDRQKERNDLLLSGSGALTIASAAALGYKRAACSLGVAKASGELRTISTFDSLRRLENVLQRIDGEPSKERGRSFAKELEYILGALNPIEIGLSEPFRRFEAGVAAVEEQLMRRDTATEDRLRAIRDAITKALERGQFGSLQPLEREGASPGPPNHGMSDSAARAHGASMAAETPLQHEARDETDVAELQRAGRHAADAEVAALVHRTYERQGERESILSGLHDWLDSAADVLEDAVGGDSLGGGNAGSRNSGGHGDGDGDDDDDVRTQRSAFHGQRDFDAELLIQKGRAQLDHLLLSLQGGAAQAVLVHAKIGDELKAQIRALEIAIAEMKMAAGPERQKLQQLTLEKEEAARKLAELQIQMHEITSSADSARKEVAAIGKTLEQRGQDLRTAIAKEAEAHEAHAAMRSQLVRSQADLESRKIQCKQLQCDLDAAEARLAAVAAAGGDSAAAAEARANDLAKNVERLQVELAAVLEATAAKEVVPPSMRSRLDGLHAEVEGLRAELKQTVAERDRAIAERDEAQLAKLPPPPPSVPPAEPAVAGLSASERAVLEQQQQALVLQSARVRLSDGVDSAVEAAAARLNAAVATVETKLRNTSKRVERQLAAAANLATCNANANARLAKLEEMRQMAEARATRQEQMAAEKSAELEMLRARLQEVEIHNRVGTQAPPLPKVSSSCQTDTISAPALAPAPASVQLPLDGDNEALLRLRRELEKARKDAESALAAAEAAGEEVARAMRDKAAAEAAARAAEAAAAAERQAHLEAAPKKHRAGFAPAGEAVMAVSTMVTGAKQKQQLSSDVDALRQQLLEAREEAVAMHAEAHHAKKAGTLERQRSNRDRVLLKGLILSMTRSLMHDKARGEKLAKELAAARRQIEELVSSYPRPRSTKN